MDLFNLSPALEMKCVNKNVHFVMQHPSLGSMTKGPIDKPEVLMPMPRPGEEPSIYICLSPVKTADLMHPKWEGCIVINSIIFVVVCRNILYCLNLGKNYLWTLNKRRMTVYIKEPQTAIFTGQWIQKSLSMDLKVTRIVTIP